MIFQVRFLSLVAFIHAFDLINSKSINVLVGGQGGLAFTPSNFSADIGDTVIFTFQNGTHSVTQSAFGTPCTALSGGRFDSNLITPNTTEKPRFRVKVDTTDPMWFYCKQANHCQKGMVGSINAKATGPKTFEAFRNLAISGTTEPPTQTSPGVFGSSNPRVNSGADSGLGVGAGASAFGSATGADPGSSAQVNDGIRGSVNVVAIGALAVTSAFFFL